MIEKVEVNSHSWACGNSLTMLQDKLNELIDVVNKYTHEHDPYEHTALDTKQELTDEDIQRKIDNDNRRNATGTMGEK